MGITMNLYSEKKGEINSFLNKYYHYVSGLSETLKWEKDFDNPIEMADFIGVFIDNNDKFKINMWISFDMGVFINVNDNNVDEIIKYMFERFPY